MKWYKFYLEVQIYGAPPDYCKPVNQRGLIACALARRDAAAHQLRSRVEFYAELKRLSTVSSLAEVTIKQIDQKEAILFIKALRELAFGKLTPFSSGLKECKDIYDQVRDGKPYTFKVSLKHRNSVISKLRGAGASAD